jgi:hypothetical protein
VEDPEGTIYRIGISWHDVQDGATWRARFTEFLRDPRAPEVSGLVVGAWSDDSSVDSSAVVEALIEASTRLPRLAALFLGEIVQEECEISWIQQCDVSPLLRAYPGLKYFWVRGADGLEFRSLRHEGLTHLAVESGGLGREQVHQLLTAHLPSLEHLELWLGVEDYGGNTTLEDLAPLLTGGLFPKLQYLGLRDSEIADDIAGAVALSPLLDRIRVLDLSLGTLTDLGARALLESPGVRRLEKLDLHHHYCSEEMMEALQELPIEVDVEELQEPDDWGEELHRYVAVSE